MTNLHSKAIATQSLDRGIQRALNINTPEPIFLISLLNGGSCKSPVLVAAGFSLRL